MTQSDLTSKSDIGSAKSKQMKERFSSVWIIPIIAVVVGGWLVFKNAFEDSVLVEVTFNDASGIKSGETEVKYRSIKVGVVKSIRFADDLTSVVVAIEFTGVKPERLTADTRFWIVKPRIGIGGVSGLDTLLSGSYIEVDPGLELGEPVEEFVGLETPDIQQLGNPGTKYTLRANNLGSISRGSPVQYRGINVGTVTNYDLTDNHHHVEIEIFVRAPHDEYVYNITRFWNISGLDVELNAEGINMNMGSVESLISGGIGFTASNSGDTYPKAIANTIFTLYESEYPKAEESLSFSVPFKMYFDKGVNGLNIGAPVEFKGLRMGTVTKLGVETHYKKAKILTYAIINIEPDRLPDAHLKSYDNDKLRKKAVHTFIEKMVSRGLRAQLKTGNLLTGQSLVTLDFFPKHNKEKMEYLAGIPVIPTVPESLSGILHQIESITAKINAMPLESISQNLDQTLASVNKLANSLDAAEGGTLGVQINEAMNELSKAANSIRALADYLERHPEALLKGKSN